MMQFADGKPIRSRTISVTANHGIIAKAINLYFTWSSIFARCLMLREEMLKTLARARKIELLEKFQSKILAPKGFIEGLSVFIICFQLFAAKFLNILFPNSII